MMALLLASSFSVPTPQPPPETSGVRVEERLGVPVPAQLTFQDQLGRRVTLGELAKPGIPRILYLGYSRCPMLCDLSQQGLVAALKQTGLTLGTDYDVLTVSINPEETPEDAASVRRGRLQSMGVSSSSSAWPFLVGREAEIQALTDAVGFHYRYDPGTREFAHPAAFILLAPDGRISRYLYSLPSAGRDLRLALVEAGGGHIGTSLDQVLLTCWRYNPASRRYAWAMSVILQGGALLVMLSLGSLLGVLWWRDFRRGEIAA